MRNPLRSHKNDENIDAKDADEAAEGIGYRS